MTIYSTRLTTNDYLTYIILRKMTILFMFRVA